MITPAAHWIYSNMLDEKGNVRCWITSDWGYVSSEYTLRWGDEDWKTIHNIHRNAEVQQQYLKYNLRKKNVKST